MTNAIWVWGNPLDYNPSTLAQRCIDGKISIIIPVLGHWLENGSISFDQNQTSIKNWIATVKSKNSNFRILGNVVGVGCYFGPNHNPDIRSQSTRITMVNNMVSTVNSLGLDGWNEDYECVADDSGGDFSALLDLWNRMGVAMKNVGKISSACTQNWGEYITTVAKNVNIDYLFPMLYSDNGFTGSTLKNYIHNQLTNSNSPLILGLGQWVSPPTLSTTFFEVDNVLSSESNTSKLRGFCIFEYWSMEEKGDWNIWNNWKTKDKYAGEVPNPPPPPTKYSCTGSPDYQCIEDANGPYSSIKECQQECKQTPPSPEPITKYNYSDIKDYRGTVIGAIFRANRRGKYTQCDVKKKVTDILKCNQ